MKKAGMIAVTLFLGMNAMAQVFDKETIVYNGDPNKHLNLVILSDGYTSSELSKFVVDATNFTTAFFNEIPYSEYQKCFNVYIVKVPSNESGASHPGTATDVTEPAHPVSTVDNYFGSTFDSYSIHRLLVATKTAKISNVLAANFPDYDLVLILVNSPYYGGSGGFYSVASTHSSSAQIAIHELGHGFAGLHDEYWAGESYASEGINMTKQDDPSLVKWKNWIGINLIGIYEYCCGGTSALWFKPHQNCKMQYLGPPFCSVCVQGTIEKIHSLVTPVESYSPLNTDIIGTTYPIEFSLNLITPDPNTLKRNWLLNGLPFKKKVDNVSISESNLISGTNTLKVTIEDTTQLLLVDNHSTIHVTIISWSIEKNTTGIKDITSSSSEIEVDLYPNPASEYINIKLLGAIKGKIMLEIYDIQGKRQKVTPIYNAEVNSINLQDLDQGIYVARILLDNNLITSKKIILN